MKLGNRFPLKGFFSPNKRGFSAIELAIALAIVVIFGIGFVVVLGKAKQGCQGTVTPPEIHHVHVRKLEIMYSSHNDDRFYRVFGKDNSVYDIRDEWTTDQSGRLYGSLREGHICKVAVANSWTCHKYPCIKKVYGCKRPEKRRDVQSVKKEETK